jgi:hypothetical protein
MSSTTAQINLVSSRISDNAVLFDAAFINAWGLAIAKFDLDGTFIMASDEGGLFNMPWGVAMAPGNFGPYNGSFLIGNFGVGNACTVTQRDFIL